MKRKYVDVEMSILTFTQDFVTTSGESGSGNDPTLDDGYELSGF